MIDIPGGNKRGPDNLGPMTGRGFGYCSGSPYPGYFRGGHSRGGRGFYRRGYGSFWVGRGRGYFWGGRGLGSFWEPDYYDMDLTDEEKLDDLNKSLEFYEKNISKIKEEIENLKKE